MKSEGKKKSDALSDSQIIDLFKSRDEKAIEVTKNKYKSLINSVSFGILNDKRDCEECESSVLFRLWNTIPPENPTSLKAYIIRLARFAALDIFRAEHRQKRIRSDMTEALDDLSDFLCDDYSVEDEILRKELAEALNVFTASLPIEKRRIFIKRYYCCLSISSISRDEGIKYKKLRNELQIIIEELKRYLTEKELI